MQPRAPLPTSAAAPPTPAPPTRLTTLAPTAAAPLAPACPAIVALCEEQAALQELVGAVSEQAEMIVTPTPNLFVDRLVANCAEVALIDAAIAPNELVSFLGGLRRQFPHVRLVVLGAAPLHEELRNQIADGTVFGFAQQPASPERLKLLLLAALRAGPPEARAIPQDTPQAIRESAPGTGSADDALGTATIPITAPMIVRMRAHARWFWPLLLCLTTLGAMIVGWYAASFASQRHLLP